MANSKPLSECDELLQRCQQADEAALGELIGHLQARLFRLALRIHEDPALAEEAVVTTFAKIWEKAHQWRGPDGAEAWILRMAVRTTLDLRRSQRRWWRRQRSVSASRTITQPVNPAHEASKIEQRQQLEEALRRLSPDDRLLIHLYYYEQRTLAQLETILDTPKNTLKMRLARARKKLAAQMKSIDRLE